MGGNSSARLRGDSMRTKMEADLGITFLERKAENQRRSKDRPLWLASCIKESLCKKQILD